MANYNKLNSTQKDVMAQFMSEHPDLAKNLLPNCAQGRITANRLWEELSKRLNAVGPPIKDAKLWKKAYADQKYNAKKKLCFNKASKRQTGGGPFQEKTLTLAEELLVEAAGLEACVEGNKTVPTFGNVASPSPSSKASSAETMSSIDNVASTSASIRTPARRKANSRTPKSKQKGDPNTVLLEENIKITADHQYSVRAKLDKLLDLNERQIEISQRELEISERQLELNERALQLKEQKHKIQTASREVDYQIKCLELESLKKKNAH